MTNTMTTKLVSAALAAACTFGSFAEVTHAQTVEFTYAAQELETMQGRKAVAQRLKAFTVANCKDAPNRAGHQLKRACRKDLTNQILQQMGNPGLGHESN